jgi:hypothetical protein|tara:strand:- start:1478 stop:1672 length:195 start_codon:yes stop_codon:yes gene_type:complete
MSNIKLTGEGGKGSAPRKNDNKKAYEDNWERIFGNKDQKLKQKQLTELNWDGDDGDDTILDESV